jgi:lipoprotein-anchoring transpeptidase ErfK/SrfK
VEETVLLRPGDVGAPYALALASRSYVLQEFAGGPGQIAVHGVLNVGGVLGTAASHGCVRVGTGAVTWLGERIGPGVPVTIAG